MLNLDISQQLNMLFRTFLSSDGDEYTLQEVADASGNKVSPGYLSYLRSGKKKNPSAEVLRTLATFFQVPVGFFFGEPLPDPESVNEDNMDDVLRDPLIRGIAMRSFGVSDQTKKLIMLFLDREKRLAVK